MIPLMNIESSGEYGVFRDFFAFFASFDTFQTCFLFRLYMYWALSSIIGVVLLFKE